MFPFEIELKGASVRMPSHDISPADAVEVPGDGVGRGRVPFELQGQAVEHPEGSA